MALFRFNITGACPLPQTNAQREWLEDLRARLRVLKAHCVVINEGQPSEEHITNFTFHICHHDTGKGCEKEQDI